MDINAPLNIHWELTNVCNLHCIHCYQQDDGPRKPLPQSTVLFAIAHKIVDAGVFELTLTGGEPLLVPQLRDLVHFFNEHGLRPHITSNGMLVDESTAQWLSEADITFQISIDGATAQAHNAIRGSKNAFKRATDGIRRLVEHGVPVSIAYTATPMNPAEIEPVVSLGASLGVGRVCIGEVLPYYGSYESRAEMKFTSTTYGTFVKGLSEIAKQYEGMVDVAIALMSGHEHDSKLRNAPCTALDRDLAILHDGWAYPCPFVRSRKYRLGNVISTSIQDIWMSSVARRFREEKSTGAPKHCTVAGSPAGPVLVELVRRPPNQEQLQS
jgi:MoaA/NifB/PqqE/SkfB family radical SAM enzyme